MHTLAVTFEGICVHYRHPAPRVKNMQSVLVGTTPFRWDLLDLLGSMDSLENIWKLKIDDGLADFAHLP